MNFKISNNLKNASFLKMRRKFTITKFQVFGVFSSRTDSFVTTKRIFYKNYSQNHFFLKKSFLHI